MTLILSRACRSVPALLGCCFLFMGVGACGGTKSTPVDIVRTTALDAAAESPAGPDAGAGPLDGQQAADVVTTDLVEARPPADGDGAETGGAETGSADVGAADTGVGDLAAGSMARLRIAHVSPDSAAIDLYVAGELAPLFTGTPYGQVSAIVAVLPGTYSFEVRPAGAVATTAPVYVSPPLPLPADSSYTLVAAGLLQSMNPADRFRVIAAAGDPSMPGTANARLRFLNAAPDLPALAFDIGSDGKNELMMLDRFRSAAAEVVAGMAVRVGVSAGTPLGTFSLGPVAGGANVLVLAIGLGARPAGAADALSLLVIAPGGTALLKRD